jgi:hypothetical protein
VKLLRRRVPARTEEFPLNVDEPRSRFDVIGAVVISIGLRVMIALLGIVG